MTKEISTDAELMSRLLTTRPTPAECLVAAARIEQLAASLTAAEAKVEKLRGALKFYRNGFERKAKRSKTGLLLSVDYIPTQALLDDCGNRAIDALSATTEADNG